VWFTEEAIQAWQAEPRTTPGGQPHYSALAISTALTMGLVFGRDRPEIWGIMTIGLGPVGYVAGWGFTDGMDAAFGWAGD
jgi:hypothetical protein